MYQKVIKESNENKIFKYIFTNKQNFVITDISENLNMSFPTVKRVVDIFLEKNIIIEKSKVGQGAGRKAREYSFNPLFCHSIGLRITPESIKIILIDATIKIKKEKFYIKEKNMYIMDFLEKSINDFLNLLTSEEKISLLGIGIATRGIVNAETNTVEVSSNFKFPLTELKKIENIFNIPILIENESNLAGITESIIGPASNLNHFISLTLSDTIGCSSFQKDNNNNFSFKAGRIHHMNINSDGNLCECGFKGCLGTYISNKALLLEFKKFYSEINNFDEIFQDKYLKNSYGKLIIDSYIKHLALGIKNLLFFSNPEKLIISGEICKHKKFIEDDLKKEIYVPNHIFYRGPETIIFSQFNENTSLIGASLFPIVDSLF